MIKCCVDLIAPSGLDPGLFCEANCHTVSLQIVSAKRRGVVGEILTRASLELMGATCGLCISQRVWRCVIQAPSKNELVSHEVGEAGCQGVSSTDSPSNTFLAH